MNTTLLNSLLVAVQSCGGATGFTDAGIRTALTFLNHIVSYDELGNVRSAEARSSMLNVVRMLAERLYPAQGGYTADERRKALAAVAVALDSTAAMLVNAGYEVI